MKKLTAYLGLLIMMVFMLSTTCIGQAQTQQTKFLLLEYGLPDPLPGAKQRTAAKWGIEFRWVAGCNVERGLIDSILMENNKMEALLEIRYGKLWREQFNKEVIEEREREQMISDLLDTVPYIQQAKIEVEKQGAGLLYFFTPVPSTTMYKVSVEGWGIWEGVGTYLKFYELLVDYRLKTIKILNDKRSKKVGIQNSISKQ